LIPENQSLFLKIRWLNVKVKQSFPYAQHTHGTMGEMSPLNSNIEVEAFQMKTCKKDDASDRKLVPYEGADLDRYWDYSPL
jgi:hypothetical protein